MSQGGEVYATRSASPTRGIPGNVDLLDVRAVYDEAKRYARSITIRSITIALLGTRSASREFRTIMEELWYEFQYSQRLE
jgi:hypothetical protein